MQFFRGRILIEKRRSIGWSGQEDWVRVWTLGALVGAFLSGLVIGVALGYAARALRVPGFVKYQASKIAVDDQRFATCRCHHVLVWATATPMERAIGREGLAVIAKTPALQKLRGTLPAVPGGRGESPEPLSGRG